MAGFFWFSDEQWARIEPPLPRDTRGMPRVDDRRVLSGIVHALKSGRRRGDCPEHVYGPKKTLYDRFRRWAERGAKRGTPAPGTRVAAAIIALLPQCVQRQDSKACKNGTVWFSAGLRP